LKPWYFVAFNLILAALVITGAACHTIRERGKSGEAGQSLLVIRDQDSGKVYGKWSLEGGGEFAIEFIHSYNKSPVRELYRVVDGMIHPFSVRFYTFGAGMHSVLEEGQSFYWDGDAMVITGFTSFYREISYIVGTISDNLLMINGETVSLRELCGRNAHIKLYIE